MKSMTTRGVRALQWAAGISLFGCLSGCSLDGKYSQAPPPISTGIGAGASLTLPPERSGKHPGTSGAPGGVAPGEKQAGAENPGKPETAPETLKTARPASSASLEEAIPVDEPAAAQPKTAGQKPGKK